MQKLDDFTNGMNTRLKEMEDKLERKIGSLSQHVDRLFGEMSAKLDLLEEATSKNEADIEDVLAARQAHTATEAMKPEKDGANKCDKIKLNADEADKFKILFAKLDQRMDEQLERYFAICCEKAMEKTNEITGTFVKGAMKVFANSIDGRLQKIEARLARDAGDNG